MKTGRVFKNVLKIEEFFFHRIFFLKDIFLITIRIKLIKISKCNLFLCKLIKSLLKILRVQ